MTKHPTSPTVLTAAGARASFEAWRRSVHCYDRDLARHPNGDYVHDGTQIRWQTWQAAMKASAPPAGDAGLLRRYEILCDAEHELILADRGEQVPRDTVRRLLTDAMRFVRDATLYGGASTLTANAAPHELSVEASVAEPVMPTAYEQHGRSVSLHFDNTADARQFREWLLG